MSNRNVVTPETALSDSLERNARGISELRTRARWPGAIQQRILADSHPCSSTPGFSPASGPNFAYPAFTTLANLRLSPGSWVLKAGVVAETTRVLNGREVLTVMRLVSSREEDPLRIAARQIPGSILGDVSTAFQLLLGVKMVNETEADVSLQVGYAYPGSADGRYSCSASAIHLLAIPA